MIQSKRRFVLASSALGLAQVLGGCVTESLFKPHEYQEDVLSVLISADRKTLVIIGKHYHYLFDAPPALADTLSAPFHSAVSAAFLRSFEVDAQGVIAGKIDLEVGADQAEADRLAAIEMGYERVQRPKDSYAARLSINLSGRRYDAGGIQPTLSAQKLNKPYRVWVRAEQSRAEKSAKALLTPITVTVDGALVIGAIPLVVLGIGLLLLIVGVGCAGKSNCLN